MAANNLFKRAAAYRKKHPGVSQAEAVSLLSKKGGKKKSAKVGGHRHHHKRKAAKKRPAKKTPAAKKNIIKKVKIKEGKKGGQSITIGGIAGISMDKIHHEHRHQSGLQAAIKKHQALLKTKGMTKQEKDHIRREIKQYRQQVSASKKHVSVLKRSI